MIKIQSVSKTLSGTTLLSEVDLSVNAGEVVGFIDAEGQSKTTLFQIIAGLLSPSQGTIEIGQTTNGKVPTIGGLIGKVDFVNRMKGLANLQYLTLIKEKIPADALRHQAKRMGLDEQLDKRVFFYSNDERQRLAIVQAYMEGQDIIILDEPEYKLEADSLDLLKSLIAELKAEGKTVLIGAKDDSFIQEICDRTFVLENGYVREIN